MLDFGDLDDESEIDLDLNDLDLSDKKTPSRRTSSLEGLADNSLDIDNNSIHHENGLTNGSDTKDSHSSLKTIDLESIENSEKNDFKRKPQVKTEDTNSQTKPLTIVQVCSFSPTYF